LSRLSKEKQEEHQQNLEDIDIMKKEIELKQKQHAGKETLLAKFCKPLFDGIEQLESRNKELLEENVFFLIVTPSN